MTIPESDKEGSFDGFLGLGRGQWAWVILLLVLLLVIAVRIHRLPVPLERDEGEYAYAGQLILEGVPPYAKAYNMKLPGIYGCYALVLALFGQTRTGIHLGLLVVNGATVLLIFLLGRRLYGPLAGAAAASGYALLSLSQGVQGVFANSEHFVVLPAVAGVLLLVRATDADRPLPLFLSGLCFGLALVIKQHGAAFAAFGLFYLLVREVRRRPGRATRRIGRLGLYLLGASTPFGLTCLILILAGVFDRFWFWTFTYAGQYVSAVPLEAAPGILWDRLQGVAAPTLLFWLIAAAGLAALPWEKRTAPRAFLLVSFLVFSFLAVCPGFYFRPHYFVLLLPSLSLLAGAGALALQRLASGLPRPAFRHAVPALALLLALAHMLYGERDYLFRMSPRMVSRTTFEMNPFPESLEVASYIRGHTTEDDTIAVVGSEPQIYFYTKRRAATGYIYTYALMESHDYALEMQEEMIEQIEKASPKFLVYVNIPSSWSARPGSHTKIFDWVLAYARDRYELVGLAQILDLENTRYLWDGAVKDYPSKYGFWVSVHRRIR